MHLLTTGQTPIAALPPYSGYKTGDLLDARLQRLQDAALDRINRALAINPKVKGLYALNSGGHDSLVSTYVASLHPLFKGVIHVNTKTSPSAELITRYTRQMAQRHGWTFIEVSPFIRYRMLIAEYGFPSPDAHEFMYQYLKGRPLKQAAKIAKSLLLDTMLGEKTIDITQAFEMDDEGGLSFIDTKTQSKQRQKLSRETEIAFVSGIRREESKKRSTAPEYGRNSGVLWINNIVDWKKTECSDYINVRGLLRNRMADETGVSGECDCGAHAAKGEIDLKCQIVPGMAEYRAKMEAFVRLSREIQLMEVEFGMRKKAIDEHDTLWGHGRKTKSTAPAIAVQDSLFRICNNCDGFMDQDGNAGIDPDMEMFASKYKRDTAA